jgi:hypothetical protein
METHMAIATTSEPLERARQPSGVASGGIRWLHDQGRLVVEPAEALWARIEAGDA